METDTQDGEYLSASFPAKNLVKSVGYWTFSTGWKISTMNERLRARYFASTETPKIHLGCGKNVLPGWLNCDWKSISPHIYLFNAAMRFPFKGDAFKYALSEHMIEHMDYLDAMHFINEVYRVLAPGGVLRISTPDFAFLEKLMSNPKDSLNNAYVEWSCKRFLPWSPWDPIYVVNNFVRAWGHKVIYTKTAFHKLLLHSGFKEVYEVQLNESVYPELRGLENESRMPDGFLRLETMAFEAVK